MTIGLVGLKCGMTRVFDEDGQSTPVSVIQIMPNKIAQIKTQENDGYEALQVAFGTKKSSKLNKAEAGHYAKSKIEAGAGLIEFRLNDLEGFEAGQELSVSIFDDISKVDVTAVSKGKGFAGTVKRHNFATQDATHGNSLSHRAPGSIGQNQSPGRVFKGKKMSGQMGNKQVTVQNLKVVKVDAERQLILVKGAIPGAKQTRVIVKPAVKVKEGNS